MEAIRLGKTKLIAILKREQIKRGVIFPGGNIPEDLETITPNTSRKESSSFMFKEDLRRDSLIYRNIDEEERILDSESEDQDQEEECDHDPVIDCQGVKLIVSYVD